MSKSVGFYGGSFDPITNGHLWVIEQALKLFDHVVIVIGTNPSKKPMFSEMERVRMIYELDWVDPSRVAVATLDKGFLVDFAADYVKEMGEGYEAHLIRGIRNPQDFTYEIDMMHVNQNINNTVNTVFVSPPPTLGSVSSSNVKALLQVQWHRWDGTQWDDLVRKYVPETVIAHLRSKKQ